MRVTLLAAVLVGAIASAAHGEVQIKVHDGRMAIEAKDASVAEILDRLAKQTGMKVIYDGQPPSQRVKVSLTERSPAEAVLGVLEGRGINFAVILNPAGTYVQTLLVSTVANRVPKARGPVPDDGVSADDTEQMRYEEGVPPPPPPILPAGNPMPPETTPGTPTAVPITMATPIPPAISPFTPQGSGPVLLPGIPGVTPIPP
jgi:hypothetical protein